MNTEIPKYNLDVIDHIIAVQKNTLSVSFGLDFEKDLDSIFPSRIFFLDYIDQSLDSEFKEPTEERIEIEVHLKNNAFEDPVNLTKFEFSQYKSLVNTAEIQFRKSVNREYLDKIPYNATLHTTKPDAEILPFTELDKPIIFFHGGLFSANLMFCKLYAQLIKDTAGDSDLPYYTNLEVNINPSDLKIVDFNCCYFYNYYFSNISKVCPSYDLKTPFEKNILAIFLNSIAFFIYAHEAGHWILKHPLSGDDDRPQTLKWRDEFEADRFAMIHLRNYCGVSQENVLTLIGPIVFFRYRLLLERYKPEVGFTTSHPPTDDRIFKYKEWLRCKIHPNDIQILDNFLSLEERIFTILSGSFDKIDKVAREKFPDKF